MEEFIQTQEFLNFCKKHNLQLVKKIPCSSCRKFLGLPNLPAKLQCDHLICNQCEFQHFECSECCGSHESEFFISEESEKNIEKLFTEEEQNFSEEDFENYLVQTKKDFEK